MIKNNKIKTLIKTFTLLTLTNVKTLLKIFTFIILVILIFIIGLVILLKKKARSGFKNLAVLDTRLFD
jgi:hypothetical protein